MNSVCEDMKDILVADGIGTYPPSTGWGIDIGIEPVKPKTCITLYDTGGRSPSYAFDNSVKPLRYDSFQVRVRGDSYFTAHDKMEEVIESLAQKGSFDVTPSGELRTNYKNIFQSTEPLFLEKNESDGFIWVCDFYAVREEKPVT